MPTTKTKSNSITVSFSTPSPVFVCRVNGLEVARIPVMSAEAEDYLVDLYTFYGYGELEVEVEFKVMTSDAWMFELLHHRN